MKETAAGKSWLGFYRHLMPKSNICMQYFKTNSIRIKTAFLFSILYIYDDCSLICTFKGKQNKYSLYDVYRLTTLCLSYLVAVVACRWQLSYKTSHVSHVNIRFHHCSCTFALRAHWRLRPGHAAKIRMIILKAVKDLTVMKDMLYRELPQSITVMLHFLLMKH